MMQSYQASGSRQLRLQVIANADLTQGLAI